MGMIRASHAQGIIEYVMIFAVVALALTVVYRYVNRSMSAKLAEVQDQVRVPDK